MPKTLVEKVTSPSPDISIFKFTGVLGYHENAVIEKFFDECDKKGIAMLIMDFTALSSLGGGCAKIIREAANAGHVQVSVVGASKMVRDFLESKGATQIVFCDQVEAALETTAKPPAKASAAKNTPTSHPKRRSTDVEPEEEIALTIEKTLDADIGEPAPDPEPPPPAPKKKPAPATKSAAAGSDEAALQRKLVQYKSLLSLNTDFNRLREKPALLDAFLLSTIAQIGVESAAFLELREDRYVMVAWKGFETADPQSLHIHVDSVKIEKWLGGPRLLPVDATPVLPDDRAAMTKWGMSYAAVFVVSGVVRALMLLGRPIRGELVEESSEFLQLLMTQASVAYENSCRYEVESQRTLGLVHSLISLIEENTISRGSTEAIVNYVGGMATAVHYPEESIRDLMYGTVLRDIGMIKVSDLIVRSPRELLKEEWEVIKRHPIEGAEMLAKMDFSEHTCEIVSSHHERFNGEGYPRGLQGNDIPVGGRIVSIVESYVAMLQERPTRPALEPEGALNTLKENWGNRYDPDLVTEFVKIVEEEIRTGKKVKYQGSMITV